ncbi:uncharacterized protein LOC34621356 [Cyclospora cayetanensis]|uniref:Uncharacterized protein LOC34621356 n=1 Tax=Cyclospora cayetanensis TaxID=88456 RepID=A0A6P6RWC4_9EIME|nr:uncharacterized protein LOC34621356 [Cyclospora cayetanensis]
MPEEAKGRSQYSRCIWEVCASYKGFAILEAPSLCAGASDSLDGTLMCLMCCRNFWTDIAHLSIVSYFFWVGVMYFTGATILLTGYTYCAPRVSKEIACPMTSSVYVFVALWLLQSIIFFFTCWAYSTVIVTAEDDSENSMFHRPNTFMTIIGFFVKTVPTWIRLAHVFNCCQLGVWTLDLLILPDCNASGLRWIVAIVSLLWWAVVAIGARAKKKIVVPAYLYDPLRPGQGVFREMRHLLRGFGP